MIKKRIHMARRLTLIYFFLLSVAIFTIHHTVYFSTFESIEQSIAEIHFDEFRALTIEKLSRSEDKVVQVGPHITAFRGVAALPPDISLPQKIETDVAFEIYPESEEDPEYFLMQTFMDIGNKQQEVWLMDSHVFYDINEEALLFRLGPMLLISVAVLMLSLLVVQRISGRLMLPLSKLAMELRSRPSADLSPLAEPEGIMTQETATLTGSLNTYRERIRALLERERAFNAYASHELRTPLMVIKGATSLLKTREDDPFVIKQTQRLEKASDDMNDFIMTLLELTKEDRSKRAGKVAINKEIVTEMIEIYVHLLEQKSVSYQLVVAEDIQLDLSLSLFKIILGNLVKNAFQYTAEGQVTIELSDSFLRISDTGIGLKDTDKEARGYGLGLVIVGDICRNQGFELSLKENPPKGCIATVYWSTQ